MFFLSIFSFISITVENTEDIKINSGSKKFLQKKISKLIKKDKNRRPNSTFYLEYTLDNAYIQVQPYLICLQSATQQSKQREW